MPLRSEARAPRKRQAWVSRRAESRRVGTSRDDVGRRFCSFSGRYNGLHVTTDVLEEHAFCATVRILDSSLQAFRGTPRRVGAHSTARVFSPCSSRRPSSEACAWACGMLVVCMNTHPCHSPIGFHRSRPNRSARGPGHAWAVSRGPGLTGPTAWRSGLTGEPPRPTRRPVPDCTPVERRPPVPSA